MNNKDVNSSFEATLPKSVATMLSSIAAKPITFDTVEVRFDVNAQTLNQYACSLSESFLHYSRTAIIAQKLDSSKVLSYLGVLLLLRVSSVNRGVATNMKVYRDSCPFPAVPAFFSLYLENVGTVTDVELGVELIPTVDALDAANLLSQISPQEFAEMSNLMKSFGKEGFEFVDTLPRDRRGSWDLMAMTCVADDVLRHDGKAHMTYALLASLCAQTHATNPLLPRVNYGPTAFLAGLIQEFGRFK